MNGLYVIPNTEMTVMLLDVGYISFKGAKGMENSFMKLKETSKEIYDWIKKSRDQLCHLMPQEEISLLEPEMLLL